MSWDTGMRTISLYRYYGVPFWNSVEGSMHFEVASDFYPLPRGYKDTVWHNCCRAENEEIEERAEPQAQDPHLGTLENFT